LFICAPDDLDSAVAANEGQSTAFAEVFGIKNLAAIRAIRPIHDLIRYDPDLRPCPVRPSPARIKGCTQGAAASSGDDVWQAVRMSHALRRD
jgi:hypothetical protein